MGYTLLTQFNILAQITQIPRFFYI